MADEQVPRMQKLGQGFSGRGISGIHLIDAHRRTSASSWQITFPTKPRFIRIDWPYLAKFVKTASASMRRNVTAPMFRWLQMP